MTEIPDFDALRPVAPVSPDLDLCTSCKKPIHYKAHSCVHCGKPLRDVWRPYRWMFWVWLFFVNEGKLIFGIIDFLHQIHQLIQGK